MYPLLFFGQKIVVGPGFPPFSLRGRGQLHSVLPAQFWFLPLPSPLPSRTGNTLLPFRPPLLPVKRPRFAPPPTFFCFRLDGWPPYVGGVPDSPVPGLLPPTFLGKYVSLFDPLHLPVLRVQGYIPLIVNFRCYSYAFPFLP